MILCRFQGVTRGACAMTIAEEFTQTPAAGIKTTARDDRKRIHRRLPRRNPFLFLLLEGERLLAGGARYDLSDVTEIVVQKGLTRQVTRQRVEGVSRLVIRLPGQYVSREHGRIRLTPEGWLVEDARSMNGTYVNGIRIAQAPLGPSDLVEMGWTFFAIQEFTTGDDAEDLADLDFDGQPSPAGGLQTLVPSLAAELRALRAVMPSRLTVSLVGEPGTGKEVLSKIIHAESRPNGPYVAVNCGSIPASLIESELFGYAKGAFSGAVGEKVGHIRAAHRGTLLLDEIVSSVPGLQEALLRVLQESEVTALGSSRPFQVDVRFLAAGQVPLDEAVSGHRFRSDLRDRLKGYTFRLPPLRERMVDIGLLAGNLLRKHGAGLKQHPRIDPAAAIRLLRYRWPGNIRELEMALERARALSPDGVVTEDYLREVPEKGPADEMARDELKQLLTENLRACSGNVVKAAEKMGKNRTLVHKWMRQLKIDANDFRR